MVSSEFFDSSLDGLVGLEDFVGLLGFAVFVGRDLEGVVGSADDDSTDAPVVDGDSLDGPSEEDGSVEDWLDFVVNICSVDGTEGSAVKETAVDVVPVDGFAAGESEVEACSVDCSPGFEVEGSAVGGTAVDISEVDDCSVVDDSDIPSPVTAVEGELVAGSSLVDISGVDDSVT